MPVNCPVCDREFKSNTSLTGHFRHQKKKDQVHMDYLTAKEEEKWVGLTEDEDYIICKVCGLRGTTLATHLRVHGLKAADYRLQFGEGALIRCRALTRKRGKALAKAHKENGSGKGEKKPINCRGCGAEQVVSKFVSEATYLCNPCREVKEVEEEKARWEGKTEPEDYVTCRACEYRAESLISHMQNAHPELIGRYHEVYPGSKVMSVNSKIRVPHRHYIFTKEQLLQFADRKGRVVVSQAAHHFEVSWITVLRNCREQNIPTKNKLATQKEVLDKLSALLGVSYAWEWNHPDLVFKETGYRMYFDGYFPSLNLIVEYHGKQHYQFVRYWHKTHAGFDARKKKDQEKLGAVIDKGHKVLVIGYYEPWRDVGYLENKLKALGFALVK